MNPLTVSDSLGLQGLKLLVLEENSDSRELFNYALGLEGVEVVAVASASEALEVAQQWIPDVVVDDIRLASEEDLELIHTLRDCVLGDREQLKAIAITGYVTQEGRDRILMSGFHECLTKPVDLDQLMAVIAQLGGRNWCQLAEAV